VTDEIIDWWWKGFPAQAAGMSVSAFVADRPSLFAAGFNWPIATLRASPGATSSWLTTRVNWRWEVGGRGRMVMARSARAERCADCCCMDTGSS